MYEYHNDNTSYNIIYSECCKHKWTAEEWKKVNNKWTKTGKYERFDTLEDAKKYALDKLKTKAAN